MNRQRPETLFHYTSAGGLLGILTPFEDEITEEIPDRCVQSSFTLWATDSRFLNDSSELRHAASALADEVAVDFNGNNVDYLVERIRDADFTTDDFGVSQLVQPTYISCFSDARDTVTQWRGYGSSGYAVEFRTLALEKMIVGYPARGEGFPLVLTPTLEQVHYELDADEIKASARRVVESFVTPTMEGVIGTAAKEAARFKHDAFQDEREWRLSVTYPSANLPVQFRIIPDGSVVPYVITTTTHTTKERPIEAIWVGPSPDKELRVEAIKALLEQRGLRYPVRASTAPFRG